MKNLVFAEDVDRLKLAGNDMYKRVLCTFGGNREQKRNAKVGYKMTPDSRPGVSRKEMEIAEALRPHATDAAVYRVDCRSKTNVPVNPESSGSAVLRQWRRGSAAAAAVV